MATEKLECGSIGKLEGGSVGLAFGRHLKRAVDDINDRPGDKSARKVSITLEITPVWADDHVEPHVVAKIKGSIPDYATSGTTCQMRKVDGEKGLVPVFNDLQGDSSPNQKTIDEA